MSVWSQLSEFNPTEKGTLLQDYGKWKWQGIQPTLPDSRGKSSGP